MMARLARVAVLSISVILVPASVRAHGLEVELVASAGAEGVTEPVRGFVGAGGRLALGLRTASDAIYSDASVAGGSLRGVGPYVYEDVGLGYRRYFGAEPQRLFWAGEVRGNMFGPGKPGFADAVWLVGPVAEIGYRLVNHLELRLDVEPAFAVRNRSVGLAVPVTLGVDLTTW